MADDITAVHVTHETVGKVGGIGAVLAGFFTCDSYLDTVNRSIIAGPLFTFDGPLENRLGDDVEVLYSSADGIFRTNYSSDFRKIEKFFNTSVIYGRRTFIDEQTSIQSSPEILLVDVRYIHKRIIDEFKKQLFEQFGIRSDLYENLWEYEQYIRLAPVAITALNAIGAAKDSTIVIAHEFMGMPTALAAILDQSCDFKTIFYAHEVATMRRITEEHLGHDTTFYNTIKQAHNNELYVSDVFGDPSCYFKHPLVEASKYCDVICAVGDHVVDELRFLAPEFKSTNIDIVYGGIPAYEITTADKSQSKEKLQRYCENLLGFRPDLIFTHVTRLVTSKGLWRDLQVLEHIEKTFRPQGKTAVYFLLSTQTAQRPTHDIYNMESTYNWPVAHREGWPDLSGGEADFYTAIQQFNAKSRNIKIVFINQFGFEPRYCGAKMPENMKFTDIRKGSDVEFGLSVYEPFGISQLEPLTFGGICVVSSVCGCAGLVRDITGKTDIKNVIITDYTKLPGQSSLSIEELLQTGRTLRKQIEENVSENLAKEIISRLPKNESETKDLIQTGYSLAKNMSWNVVVKNYLLSSFQKTARKQHHARACSTH